MFRVDGTNGVVHALVKTDDGAVRLVCRLIEGVVPRDPRVPGIMPCELCPQPDRAVLKVLVDPKVGDVGASVTVPVHVLPAWCGVEIEDGVDAVSGAEINGAVEMFEAFCFEDAGVHVIWGWM